MRAAATLEDQQAQQEVVAQQVAEKDAAACALEDEMAQVCGALNATTARLVGVISRVLETESWSGYGVRSPEQWVGWKCGVAPERARRLVAMARRLPELPDTSSALAEGALAEDQAALICAKAPTHADAAVASFARHATVAQLRRVLADYVWDDDDATPVDPEPNVDPAPEPDARRHTRFNFGDDGWWHLSALLPPDQGALVEKALEAAWRSLYDQATDAGSRRELSWADALVELAERSLGPAASTRAHHDRHMVLVHLREGGSHLHLGPGLPQSLRRYLGCDGWVRPVIDRGAVATSVGRALHIVADRTRMAVEERDRGCRVPWCDHTRWLQVHHVVHWEDGGATDTANLVGLCARHHRLHHQGRLGISGNADDPNGLVFTDEWGRRLTGLGRPAPPGDLVVNGTWTPPSGERLQRKWVHLG